MGLVNLKLIISLISFLLNLILILWINNSITLSKIVYTGLFIFLPWFEFIRIILMVTSGIITVRIKQINRKFKAAILIFLIRLFGFACFAPVYSFSSMPSIIISFVLINIQEYDNNRI